MARVQLALNVTDRDAAVGFYSKLFGFAPSKRRPGYANFAIVEPPLKLAPQGLERRLNLTYLLNQIHLANALTLPRTPLPTLKPSQWKWTISMLPPQVDY